MPVRRCIVPRDDRSARVIGRREAARDAGRRSRAVIAVSGLHRGENPQPGSAVIAALRQARLDVRIVGLVYDTLESGIFTTGADVPDVVYTMPYPSAGAEHWLERLADITRRERLDAVVPCLDPEIEVLAPATARLAALGIRTWLPTPDALRSRDKAALAALVRAAHCDTPETVAVNDVAALHAAAERIGGAVFIKGRLYEAVAAVGPLEREQAFQGLAARWGVPVMVQQRIDGEEFNVTGLGDGKGAIVACCAIRKMLRTAAGKGFAGIVVDNEALMQQARSLIAALRWSGPFELEFVADESTGQFFLLEINPRFPAWIGFPAALGNNLPAALIARLLGEPAPPLADCAPGRFFIRHCVDLVGNLDALCTLASTGMSERTSADSAGVVGAMLDIAHAEPLALETSA
jgi:carbamoyl-phosphate synthase large subunit